MLNQFVTDRLTAAKHDAHCDGVISVMVVLFGYARKELYWHFEFSFTLNAILQHSYTQTQYILREQQMFLKKYKTFKKCRMYY